MTVQITLSLLCTQRKLMKIKSEEVYRIHLSISFYDVHRGTMLHHKEAA